MPQPLIVSIPHNLAKDEAVRRIKSGLTTAKTTFARVFSVQEETWVDNCLRFRIAALGQTASGTIEVADDHVRLEVTLPWLLAKAARQVQRVIQRQGTTLLEKK